MKLPKYDGNIHPNEWLKQIQIYCFLKKIVKEEDILEIAKMMIDSEIIKNIPVENIISLDELINILKKNLSFLIFKESCKKKLLLLKYKIENNNTSNFILEFKILCRDAEIINFDEQKNFFIQTLPKNYINIFKEIQFKNNNNNNSINELIKEFDYFILNYPKIIKNGSCIALKHFATGKYLSTCDKKYDKSNKQVVYCGDAVLNNNALWIININTNNFTSLITYQSSITLKHKSSSNNYLSIDTEDSSQYKACCNESNTWTLQHIKSSENERNYLKSQDNVLLKTSFGHNTPVKNLTLRSHEINFKIGNETYQEVFAHESRIGGIDEWCIELIE